MKLYCYTESNSHVIAGADPGFPVGGAWTRFGGCGPPTQGLTSENVCENERIGCSGEGGGMRWKILSVFCMYIYKE